MLKPMRPYRAAWCVLVLVAATGCAARRARTSDVAATPLEEFIAKVREASLAPRPPRANDAASLEKTNPELIAARLALSISPTAENHRRVGELYARLGVADAAYDHFMAAIRLTPRDAAAWDGLAR